MTSPPPRVALSDKEIATAITDLPPVSNVVQRLLVVLADAHSGLSDVARLVKTDTALSAQILRISNSVLYTRGDPVSTLEQGLQRIGYEEIGRLVIALHSRSLFAGDLGVFHISAAQLWRHSLAVAVSAEIIASLLDAEDRGSAYLAGILHPVGLLVLERIGRRRGATLPSRHGNLPEWEREVFGTDNAAVAAQALSYWKLPEPLVRAVASRYKPDEPKTELDGTPRPSVLYLASYLARRLGTGLTGETSCFVPSASQLHSAGLHLSDLGDAEIQAWQSLQRVEAVLKVA